MRRALFGLVVAIGMLAVAAPAGAHDDEGVMTVIETVPEADGRTVRIDVGIEYEGDGHLAEEAEVAVAGTGPDGAVLDPTPLPHASGGRYSGTVVLDAPGAWSLTVTSTNPESSAPVEVVEEQPATTTTALDTTTTVPPTTEATATTATTLDPVDTEPSEEASNLVPILSAIGLATLVVFGVALYLRGKKVRADIAERDDQGSA